MAPGPQLFMHYNPSGSTTAPIAPLLHGQLQVGQEEGLRPGPQVSPRASRLRLMLLASSISSPRDPVAATFSLPARSTKHSFPPEGGSLGSTGGTCWDWGVRA